jgi:hypothetical protein
MRYGLIAAGFYVAVRKSFQRELALLPGAYDAGRVMREAKTRYKEMIRHAPSGGGCMHPFTMNILAAAWGASLYLAGKNVLSPEETGSIFSRSLERTAAFRLSMKSKAKVMFTERGQERWREWAAASRAAQPPGGFVFDFIPGKTRDEYGIDFKECGICRLFEREGCPEFAPYLCRFDYVMARHTGCRLTRRHTIAAGDRLCDFRFSKGIPDV